MKTYREHRIACCFYLCWETEEKGGMRFGRGGEISKEAKFSKWCIYMYLIRCLGWWGHGNSLTSPAHPDLWIWLSEYWSSTYIFSLVPECDWMLSLETSDLAHYDI